MVARVKLGSCQLAFFTRTTCNLRTLPVRIRCRQSNPGTTPVEITASHHQQSCQLCESYIIDFVLFLLNINFLFVVPRKGSPVIGAKFGRVVPESSFSMDDTDCTGRDTHLLDCEHRRIMHDCLEFQVAGVRCSGPALHSSNALRRCS